jgi:hypothetical protein
MISNLSGRCYQPGEYNVGKIGGKYEHSWSSGYDRECLLTEVIKMRLR